MFIQKSITRNITQRKRTPLIKGVQEWTRWESNPCPKTLPLFFYYHSPFFHIPSE